MLSLKFLKICVASLVFILIAMIAGRFVVGEPNRELLCKGVMDAQGHGPDVDSVEWWQACYHQMLVGSWVRSIEGQDIEDGFKFNPDRTLEFVNIMSMTGDRWELTSNLNLHIWSHTERYPDPQLVEYKIVKITDKELVISLIGVESSMFYRKLTISE